VDLDDATEAIPIETSSGRRRPSGVTRARFLAAVAPIPVALADAAAAAAPATVAVVAERH